LAWVDEGIPQGLKPLFCCSVDAWAKAQAYLRGKSKYRDSSLRSE